MSVASGRRRFADRSAGDRPSINGLSAAKDYAALAKRGALGRGALKAMARRGDQDARAALSQMGEAPPPDDDPYA